MLRSDGVPGCRNNTLGCIMCFQQWQTAEVHVVIIVQESLQ